MGVPLYLDRTHFLFPMPHLPSPTKILVPLKGGHIAEYGRWWSGSGRGIIQSPPQLQPRNGSLHTDLGTRIGFLPWLGTSPDRGWDLACLLLRDAA